MTKTATVPLTGKALLQRVNASNLPKQELAKESGYYSVNKKGKTRVNLAEFYSALLAAKGIDLEPESTKDGRGREASFRARVHQNGQIFIGSNYTKSMGLKPGDQFEIKLGYKHIHLIQLDGNKTEVTDEDEE